MKRVFLVMSVGGGFTGMVVTMNAFSQTQNAAGLILLGLMVGLYGFGVHAGLTLVENERLGLWLLRIFFALQVPVFSSPMLAYYVSAGLGLFVSFSFADNRLNFFFRLGGEMGFSVLQNRPWILGINVAGLVLFLCSTLRLERIPPTGSEVPPPLENENETDGDASPTGVVEGGLYAVPDSGGYGVFKVLKIDERGVHLRRYANRFPEWPTAVDEPALSVAGATPDAIQGVDHLPVSYESFRAWKTQFLQRSVVRDNELEAYRIWREANGGYF